MSMEKHGGIMSTEENSWLVQISVLIVPEVIWEQVGGMDERSENFFLASISLHLQVIFLHAVKSYIGPMHTKQGVLRIFITSARFEFATLGSSEHTNCYTTEATTLGSYLIMIQNV
jgi:hypothetical protein